MVHTFVVLLVPSRVKKILYFSFKGGFYSFLCCPCTSVNVHVVRDFSGCQVNPSATHNVHDHGTLNGKIYGGKRCRSNKEEHNVEKINRE